MGSSSGREARPALSITWQPSSCGGGGRCTGWGRSVSGMVMEWGGNGGQCVCERASVRAYCTCVRAFLHGWIVVVPGLLTQVEKTHDLLPPWTQRVASDEPDRECSLTRAWSSIPGRVGSHSPPSFNPFAACALRACILPAETSIHPPSIHPSIP